jgi:DNA ligase 1
MFISPMLLQSTELPFDDDSYITELKLDGIRLILSKWNNKIKLYTRHNNEVTTLFPELTNIDIPDGTILDREIVVSDNQGKPDLDQAMELIKARGPS